jgi:hypothetical protein
MLTLILIVAAVTTYLIMQIKGFEPAEVAVEESDHTRRHRR